MPEPTLDAIRRIYAVWGRHPLLYAARDRVTFLGRHRTIRRRAVEAAGVAPGARVLEVACGTERNFHYIEERIGPVSRIVAVDVSREMLAAAGALCWRRHWYNVELVQGDAAVLDVGQEPFDAVICVLGMSAMPDHRAALRCCHELLRPGGLLAVCDARPFDGVLRVLNPVVRAVYTRRAAWSPDRDIPFHMWAVFGNVSVETFNLGSFFIATSRKERGR